MIQATSDLTNAVKMNIGPLSDELLSQGLIASDNKAAAINQMIDVGQRASQLVSLVRTRVQLNPGNFHKFVRILLKNASHNHEILKILDNKYRALGTCVFQFVLGGGIHIHKRQPSDSGHALTRVSCRIFRLGGGGGECEPILE